MTFRLFSSTKSNSGSLGQDEKFELVSCKLNGKYCKEVRSAMNRNYAESVDFRVNREYDKSLNALEKAYYKANELPDSPCAVCVAFYQSTISESVKSIHQELRGMSKGLFRTNRYQSSCEKAEDLLCSMENGKNKLKKAV